MQPEHEVYCEVDVNECNRGGCSNISNSTCVNTYGSFFCKCDNRGFELNAAGDACTDVDECSSVRHNCARQARCINTHGSFFCQCDAGFLTPEEVALLGNCSASHIQSLLFRQEKAGVRILFPQKGPGTVCVELDECQAHACATLPQLCVQTNHKVEGCAGLQWINGSAQQALLPAAESVDYGLRNTSSSTGNSSNASDGQRTVEQPQEGVLVHMPPCPTHSQCYNSRGSYQVNTVNH